MVVHLKVLDAAVIGVPNEEFGEEVKVVVELVDCVEGSPALEAEFIDYCREQIAHFNCERSVDFVAELPCQPTGKLYKRLLRDRYCGRHGTKMV